MIDKIIFISQKQIESILDGWGNWAVISITDSQPANLSDGWSRTLRLTFDDISASELDHHLMTDAEAFAVVDFVRNLPADTEGILVHCVAGVSRSAAVAKWISGEFRIPFGNYKRYNQYVYKQLIEAGNRHGQ